MKIFVFFSSAVCALLVSCSNTGSASATGMSNRQNGGHLVIQRSANFGTDLFLVVSIDGKEVASVGEGKAYDGYLSPGTHVVSVIVGPNGQKSAKKTLNVVKGQTYSFTAKPKGETSIVLL